MWILSILFVVLIIVSILLNFKRLRLQQQVDSIIPMLEVVENLKDIMYYCELKPHVKYRYLSPVVDQFFGEGATQEHLENPGIIFSNLVHPDDRHILVKKTKGELDYSKPIVTRLKNADGEYIWFEEYATPVFEQEELVAIQGVLRDISEKVELQQKLEYKVTHDALTDVYNRGFFESQLDYFNWKRDAPVAVLICDVDELKLVNDHFGHKAGDSLIRETAKLLNRTVIENEIVARIGGDEFAVIFSDTELLRIENYLTKLRKEIDLFNSKSRPYRVKMSVGFAYSRSSLGKMDALFVEADKKMYEEKIGKRKLVEL